jgi:glycosyltransferase involved in cell wall biosynthesis
MRLMNAPAQVMRVWRERGLRGVAGGVYRMVRRTLSRSTSAASVVMPIPVVSRNLNGIDVVGFFTAEHGVGEAARVLVSTLKSADVAVSTINYTDTQSRMGHTYATDDVSRHKAVLVSMNAEQLTHSPHRLGAHFYNDRYVIGQWFWELEQAPQWYAPAWPIVNEMWAPTRFIEQMLRNSAPKIVTISYVPLPVTRPAIDATLTREFFGLDDRFTFLFAFDFMSVMKRKNPLGLIDAFTQAFAPGTGPRLIIKAINGDKRPVERDALLAKASQHPDITVIDTYFTRIETSSLMNLVDCYVSLHRSEGLGLTLSEAMSHGKPVIATGYSGNLDFMDETNSYLVPWTRVPVGDNAEGYSPDATWAEPKLDEAAKFMRYVFENQAEAVELGQKAQSDILNRFSEAASGAIMKNRLSEIWNQLMTSSASHSTDHGAK